jgi:hypothetical protein
MFNKILSYKCLKQITSRALFPAVTDASFRQYISAEIPISNSITHLALFISYFQEANKK